MRLFKLRNILCAFFLLVATSSVTAQEENLVKDVISSRPVITIKSPDPSQGRIKVVNPYTSSDITSGTQVDKGDVIEVRVFEKNGNEIEKLLIGDNTYTRDQLGIEYGFSEKVRYTVQNDITISVVYKEKESELVKLLYYIEPENAGTITCVDDKGKSYGDFTDIAIGTAITLTITPSEGYRLTSIECGDEHYQESDGTLSAVMGSNNYATIQQTITKKLIVRANFEEIPVAKPIVTIEQPDPSKGRIKVVNYYTKTEITSGSEVDKGDIIEVQVYEYDNNEIEKFIIGDNTYTREQLGIEYGFSEKIQYTVQSDITISVVYKEKETELVKLLFYIEPENAGTITCVDDKGKSYGDFTDIAIGTAITLTITPSEGYRLTSIECGDEHYQESNGTLSAVMGSNNYATIQQTITKKLIVRANFEKIPVAKPIVRIEQPDPSKGRIKVVNYYTKTEITSGSEVDKGDIIEVQVYEYDNNEIEKFIIGDNTYTREQLGIEYGFSEKIQYTVQSDITISVVYKEKEAELVKLFFYINPDESAGTITCIDDNGQSYADFTDIAVGTSVTLTITPSEGYRLTSIECGDEHYQESDGTLSAVMGSNNYATIQQTITKKLIVRANFEEIPVAKPIITINQPDPSKGRIQVIDFNTKIDITSGSEVDKGDIIEVIAYEYDNYEIEQLVIGDKVYNRDMLSIEFGASANIQYTVQEDITISVTYQVKDSEATISWTTPSAQEGQLQILTSEGIELQQQVKMPLGEKITVVATPHPGYRVESIAINNAFFTEDQLTSLADGAKSVEHMLSGDVHVTVQFVSTTLVEYTLTYSWPEGVVDLVTVTCAGKAVSSGDKLHEGDKLLFSLRENDNYMVNYWQVNGVTQASGKANLTVTMPNENLEVKLFVKEAKRYPIVYSCNEEGGLLVVRANELVVNSGDELLVGTEVVFEALPYDDYEIGEWLHNGEPVNGNSMTYKVIVSYDINLQLRFAKKNSLKSPDRKQDTEEPYYSQDRQAWIFPSGTTSWRLCSMLGELISQGVGDSVDATGLLDGLYLISTDTSVYKVVK